MNRYHAPSEAALAARRQLGIEGHRMWLASDGWRLIAPVTHLVYAMADEDVTAFEMMRTDEAKAQFLKRL